MVNRWKNSSRRMFDFDKEHERRFEEFFFLFFFSSFKAIESILLIIIRITRVLVIVTSNGKSMEKFFIRRIFDFDKENLGIFLSFFFQVSRLSNLFLDGIIRVFVIVTSNNKSMEKLREKNLTDTRKGLRSILYITRFEVE